MTNENDLEKKILIIDDSDNRHHQADILFGDRVVGPMPLSEEKIEHAMKTEQYGLILMDGNLELYLEGQYFDGIVVSRKLREGAYGEINKNTPIVFTSSGDAENKHAQAWISIDMTFRKEPKDYARKREEILQYAR